MRKLTNLETGETIDLPGDYSVDEGQQSASHAVDLRDYFAAHAGEPPEGFYRGEVESKPTHRARWSYAFADAMLKERAK